MKYYLGKENIHVLSLKLPPFLVHFLYHRFLVVCALIKVNKKHDTDRMLKALDYKFPKRPETGRWRWAVVLP